MLLRDALEESKLQSQSRAYGRTHQLLQFAQSDISQHLSSWCEGRNWPALELVRKNESNKIGEAVDLSRQQQPVRAKGETTGIYKSTSPGPIPRLIRRLTGRVPCLPSPHLPPLLAEAAILCVECVSALSYASLTQDRKGFTVHYIPTILHTLLTLHDTLNLHEGLYCKYYSLHPRAKQVHRDLYFRAGSCLPMKAKLPPAAASMYPSLVCVNTIRLLVAVGSALELIVSCYSDHTALRELETTDNYGSSLKLIRKARLDARSAQ